MKHYNPAPAVSLVLFGNLVVAQKNLVSFTPGQLWPEIAINRVDSQVLSVFNKPKN